MNSKETYNKFIKNIIFTSVLSITFITFPSNAKTILLSMSANTNGLRYANNDNKEITKALKHVYKNQLIVHQIFNVTKKTYKIKINKIKKQLNKGDNLIVYFSGHGTTIYDLDDEEKDGFDEALISFSRNNIITEAQLITDDELSADLRWLNAGELIVVLDTCLSGGMHKALSLSASAGTSKYTFNSIPLKKHQPTNIFKQPEGTKGMLDNVRGVLFAASKEGQEAFEYNNKELQGGIFTVFLVQALYRTNNINNAFRDAKQQVSRVTKNQQTPQKYNYR